MQKISYLRDVQIATPLEYPGVKLNIDRVKAGQLGLTVDQITRSTVAATSSSRFTQPNYWLDKNTGTAYQVQVEYPQYRVSNADDLGLVPVTAGTVDPVFYVMWPPDRKPQRRVSYDRINQQRYITITANIHNKDVGTAVKEVKNVISSLGQLPQGVKIMVRGQADLLAQTMNELAVGLLIAIVVIFLMLTVNFQSFRLSLAVISVIPAVISGALLLLLLTGQSLNIQSYMGTIMAVGVAVANAILLITNGEQLRQQSVNEFAVTGAGNRLRPYINDQYGDDCRYDSNGHWFGEGGDQTSPLGIAVIGGLIFSTISTLIFLPSIYTSIVGKKSYHSPSLHPEDKNSRYYEVNNN